MRQTYHLYVILEVFSRYVVGWMLAVRESAQLAEQLIADTVEKHNIAPATLTLHVVELAQWIGSTTTPCFAGRRLGG